MKRYAYILIIGIFLLGCVSCSNQGNGYKDTWLCPADSLQSEVFNSTFLLAKPTGLFVYDSILIVSDARCGNNLFYAFNTYDGSFLKGGGKKGEAPGEVLTPGNVHLDKDGRLSYWDIHKHKLICYDMNIFLKDSTVHFTECLLKNEHMKAVNILDATVIEDGYLYNSNTEQHIGIYQTESYMDAPSLPGISSMEICRAIMNRGHLEVSPDNKYAIRATSIGGIVQCYDIENGAIKEKWIKLFFPPNYKIAEGAKPIWITWKPETQMGFDDLFVTNQAVYLLLNGKFAKDKPYANEVLVMDWNGHIIKKYWLDQTVSSIAVNEAQSMLYAITCGFGVEPNIISFAL